jgi:hypothetical protein
MMLSFTRDTNDSYDNLHINVADEDLGSFSATITFQERMNGELGSEGMATLGLEVDQEGEWLSVELTRSPEFSEPETTQLLRFKRTNVGWEIQE